MSNTKTPSQCVSITRGTLTPCARLTGAVRIDDQAGDGIYQPKDEVGYRQPSNPDHGPTKSRFHDTVAHAYDEKEEERERVAHSVEDGNHHEQNLRAQVRTGSIQMVCRIARQGLIRQDPKTFRGNLP